MTKHREAVTSETFAFSLRAALAEAMDAWGDDTLKAYFAGSRPTLEHLLGRVQVALGKTDGDVDVKPAVLPEVVAAIELAEKAINEFEAGHTDKAEATLARIQMT